MNIIYRADIGTAVVHYNGLYFLLQEVLGQQSLKSLDILVVSFNRVS